MSAIDVLVNTRVSAEHADTFQRLETAAQQIESQMKDLTDYAHLDSGMMELRIVPFDAQKLIAETANEIATLTRKGRSNSAARWSAATCWCTPIRCASGRLSSTC